MDNIGQKIRRFLLTHSIRQELRRRGASTQLLDAAARLVDAAEGSRDLGILTNMARDAARGQKSLKRDTARRETNRQNAGHRGNDNEHQNVWGGWQKEADKLWKTHPEYSKRAVARLIKKSQFETIRRRIKKLGK